MTPGCSRFPPRQHAAKLARQVALRLLDRRDEDGLARDPAAVAEDHMAHLPIRMIERGDADKERVVHTTRPCKRRINP
ncbi:MAG: hypothetical protein A3F70_04120 [Acidobacteria bacterium RIFCSPLOWO2_12_FULL_67_14]|nr:MAG: hypothetical protein A3H29_00980 [Acidobacteria bacterium RIFCSPLOWO2_02_FULL_67_21]OFW37603.1 MAG: hypothetical protein A3F70_04120 [Acidobacteria bacterium RIFCSPLOWO2_12_FULL_67_14]